MGSIVFSLHPLLPFIYIIEITLNKMKPNRTNSFRLQRISRASSFKKTAQNYYHSDDTFKLAAINSVTRGVKHNDTSYLVGSSMNKLRIEPTEDKDQLYEFTHLNLAETRKKYDDMKKQRVNADENIYRLREEIKKYRIFEGDYLSKVDNGRKNVENLGELLEKKKLLLDETIMEKKVLAYMRLRLKEDKIVYDQRKFNFEKQAAFQKKQLTIFKRENNEVDELGDRADKMLSAYLKELKVEENERRAHINSLEAMIFEKRNSQEINIERGHKIMEIAERAMQDKDNTEKQWHKIYLCHAFVSHMLRNKIDRQMQKFGVVEMAFQQIKIATGVDSAERLVEKYLNKEEVYGNLLSKITHNQARIADLMDESQFLKKEEKQLEMEKETIENIKVGSISISKEIHEMNAVSEQKKSIETSESNLKQWLSKQFKKFSVIDRNNAENYSTLNKQNVKDSFIRFLSTLQAVLEKCEKQESETNTDAGDLSARDSARVTRVIPKRSRRNSIGQQIFDVEEEELPQTAEQQQTELIDNQREEMIKTNERFMKEARKRREEKRKLLIEKVVEKKEVKVVEQKKEDD